MQNPPDLILVRGHPGSGKTTHALALKAFRPALVHIENDQAFTDENGHYTFDLARHQEAKDSCLQRTAQALSRGLPVVVSNTFTTRAELAPYIAMATQMGKRVGVVEMFGQFPNHHDVPEAVVTAKKEAFESYPGAHIIHPEPVAKPSSRRPGSPR